MQNVYDLKKNYILSNSINESEQSIKQYKIAVFIHLYYMDTVDYYVKYINVIPASIDVYISYTDEQLKRKIQMTICRHAQYVRKENRGRDVSALLVAFRELMLQYEFISFLHDKKEKTVNDIYTVQEWVFSLWENQLSTDIYINNIISRFVCEPHLGLLVPPIVARSMSNIAYKNMWEKDFENVTDIARKLSLNCDLDERKTPITLGTCFWAKTDALRKLLDYKWDYLDFQAEPLPVDGSFSHAIERIFAYVAQDAGYETGWVMTDKYAAEYLDKLNTYLRVCMNFLKNEQEIEFIDEVYSWNTDVTRMKEFVCRYESIYVYGNGIKSVKTNRILDKLEFKPTAIVVTKKCGHDECVCNGSIKEITEIDIDSNSGFILAVGSKNMIEIKALLLSLGVTEEQMFIL